MALAPRSAGAYGMVSVIVTAKLIAHHGAAGGRREPRPGFRVPPVSLIWIPGRRRTAPGHPEGPDPGRRPWPGTPLRSRPLRPRLPGCRRMRLPGASVSLFRYDAERRGRLGRTRADPPFGVAAGR